MRPFDCLIQAKEGRIEAYRIEIFRSKRVSDRTGEEGREATPQPDTNPEGIRARYWVATYKGIQDEQVNLESFDSVRYTAMLEESLEVFGERE
jgi:hypothetical protein